MFPRLLFILIIVAIAAGGLLVDVVRAGKIPTKFEYSVCDRPIYYEIGEVDREFGVKKEKLLSAANQAAQIWNKAAGKDIFRYRSEDLASEGPSFPTSAVTIDFKYDKRHALTTQINQLEGKVYKDEGSLKGGIAEYEARVRDFNSRMEAFNAEVQEWNEKGGAPPETYEELKKRQQAFQDESSALQAQAAQLDASVENYKSQVGKLNTTIDVFNSELAKRPEEGLFSATENKIEIFFFANQTELLHTLTHEFGHARGLDHVEDEKAIMFPYTTSVLKLAEDDVEALDEICRERNVLDESVKFGKNIVERYKLLLSQRFI